MGISIISYPMVDSEDSGHGNIENQFFHGWLRGFRPWEYQESLFPWLMARIQAMGISRITFSMVDSEDSGHGNIKNHFFHGCWQDFAP